MKRLLLAVIVLVTFLIVPVSAWTELYSYTSTNQTAAGALAGIAYVNASNDNLITRIVWNGSARLNSGGSPPYSGSMATTLEYSSAIVGNATITWQGWDAYNTYQTVGITIDILDIDVGFSGNRAVELKTFYDSSTDILIYKSGDAYTTWLTDENAVTLQAASATDVLKGSYVIYGGSEVNTPVASFTCTPTSQFPDESVVCTDTSTNTPTDWYWSIDAEAMGIDGWLTGNSQNFTWYSHYPGLYSVNLRANNSAGSDWENKTNYVSISDNATPNNCNIPVLPGLIRSWAQCVDSQTSGAISGCDLSLYDLEGGAWSNVTDRFDGTWCIDTYPAHHFNAYGSADGYTPDPTYRLNLNVNEHVVYELLMHPGYVPPAAEGKVWVYGIVNDADTGAAIEGAVFRLDASGQTPKSDTTDASGSMHIQWVNKTQTTATASKPGYGTISKVFTTSDFGPDTVRIEIHRSIVTPTPTATTGPGGTVPTTVNPNGPVNGVYPSDYTNTQGQAIMNLLAYHGYDLVLLCIFVTMLALLGFKLGK